MDKLSNTAKPSESEEATPPKEIAADQDNYDPTKFGDWERHGRCLDF
jgi:hypothetical protein